jgi:hypothetical protein
MAISAVLIKQILAGTTQRMVFSIAQHLGFDMRYKPCFYLVTIERASNDNYHQHYAKDEPFFHCSLFIII